MEKFYNPKKLQSLRKYRVMIHFKALWKNMFKHQLL